jgi:hypothetical protein
MLALLAGYPLKVVAWLALLLPLSLVFSILLPTSEKYRSLSTTLSEVGDPFRYLWGGHWEQLHRLPLAEVFYRRSPGSSSLPGEWLACHHQVLWRYENMLPSDLSFRVQDYLYRLAGLCHQLLGLLLSEVYPSGISESLGQLAGELLLLML